jgi:hypothetical protein
MLASVELKKRENREDLDFLLLSNIKSIMLLQRYWFTLKKVQLMLLSNVKIAKT